MPVTVVQLLVTVFNFYSVVSFASNISPAYALKRREQVYFLDYYSA